MGAVWIFYYSHEAGSLSESEFLYNWRFTDNQFILATSPLRLSTNSFIFQLNTCSYSPYVTSSLMRGWVCRLQLLLVLASAVILSSKSSRTHDHNLLSLLWDSPNLEGQVPVFISPRYWVPFLSPPTVQVFDAATSTWERLIVSLGFSYIMFSWVCR
jgi:hypothetical protein